MKIVEHLATTIKQYYYLSPPNHEIRKLLNPRGSSPELFIQPESQQIQIEA